MNQPAAHPIDEAFAAHARIQRADYERLYERSVADPEAFWGDVGQRLDWMKAPTREFTLGCLVLLYYDRRIRTEAYDVEVAAEAIVAATP